MSTKYFNPRQITGLFRLDDLAAAYQHADLAPPTIAEDTYRLLEAEPTVEAVRNDFARAAVEDGDAKKLLDSYVKNMNRALAVEKLAEYFLTITEGMAAENLEERINDCIKAIRPAFNRTAKALADVAGKLDRTNPLDRETAFDTDTTGEWKQATALLTELGGYVVQVPPASYETLGTGYLLALVTIPDTTPERGTANRHTGWRSEPGQPGAAERGRIRALAREYQQNPDLTVLRIARGDYEGMDIRLDLADVPDLERRATAYANAHARINTLAPTPA